MSEHNISMDGGTTVRLKTAGKYCDRDILVTASGTAVQPSLEELSVFDPTKETLIKRSTATQNDIFVTKTMIAFVNSGKYAGYVGCKFNAVVGETYVINWDQINSSDNFVFYYESDVILTKVDDHYGTRLYPQDNGFEITATKPYMYIYVAKPSVPNNNLVCVIGLTICKKSDLPQS